MQKIQNKVNNSIPLIYPKCINTFNNWLYLEENSKYLKKYQNIISKPKLFDVSLRDGLQCLTKEEQNKVDIENKKKIYHEIIYNYKPDYIEVGSLVSPKVLPIMQDTSQLFEYCDIHSNILNTNNKHFLLIPNFNKLIELKQTKKYIYCNYYSFITSVSSSFQKKNVNKSLEESKCEISRMIDYLYRFRLNNFIKLYISCINECPILGKLDNDYIVEEILYYYKYNLNNICLSDTCGSLSPTDFDYIINKCINNGVSPSILSLHLHINKNKENEETRIQSIINIALEKNISCFDVSMLQTGGCPVALNVKEYFLSNLSYELFYKCFVNYIINENK
jgi:hypothetical protein